MAAGRALAVTTADGRLVLEAVQLPGGRVVSGEELLRGHPEYAERDDCGTRGQGFDGGDGPCRRGRRGSPAMTTDVGIARPRPDAPAKVRGATRYAADRYLRGLLHARLVLSPRAHARIAGLEIGAALETPGVVAVLAAGDLPIVGGGTDRLSMPLAASEVVFAGQPVALVVARTPEAAADGAEQVFVDLEALPAAIDAEAVMDPNAPLARVDLAGGRRQRPAAPTPRPTRRSAVAATSRSTPRICPPNVTGRYRYREGDVGAAFEGAASVREGRFASQWIHQGYLEPQACTAWLDDDGTARPGDLDTVAVRSPQRGREGARLAAAQRPSGRACRWAGRSAGSGRSSTPSLPPRP